MICSVHSRIFSSQSYRYELENYVKSNTTTYGTVDNNNYSTTRVAMTDASFNTLYDNISNTYGWGAKMTAISDAFNVSTNYFTVEQTEKLIRLVSSEDNRLQLAKQAYTHLTDPQNIADLYDIFSSQSYIDELKSYIASH
jgi:hypothetical protein